MGYYYSPGARGFYSTAINTDIPPDAVAITDEQYQQLLAGQSQNKVIVPGDGGVPVLEDAPLPDLSQAEVTANLISVATYQANAVVSVIYPDPTRQAAFQNAAAIVNANANAAPTTEPLASKFAALAKLYLPNATPDEFATMVANMQGISFDLSIALSTLTAEAGAAKDKDGLLAALNTFTQSLSTIIGEVNSAGLPVQIEAPTTLHVFGLN